MMVVACATAVAGVPVAAWGQTPGYLFPGVVPGGVGSGASAVSADGRFAAGMSTSSNGSGVSPFVWSEASGRYDLALTEPATANAFTRGISDNGSVLVGQAGGSRAFRWRGPGTYQFLPLLTNPNQPVHDQNAATGVSGDGSIVVGRSYRTQYLFGQAFRWTEATGMQPLGFTVSGHVYSEANAISRDGNVIVGMSQAANGRSDAFRWTALGGMQALPLVADTTSAWAQGTNHDGSIISGFCDDFGVLWRGTSIQILQNPPFWACRGVTDLSDDGSVVLGVLRDAAQNLEPRIWTPLGGWQTPSVYFAAQGFPLPQGWEVSSVASLSADGRTFCGSAFANGRYEGFVLTIPNPGTFFVFAAFSATAFRRRR